MNKTAFEYFMIHMVLYIVGIVGLVASPFLVWGCLTCLFAGQILWTVLLGGFAIFVARKTLVIMKANAKARALYARAKNN